MVKLKCSTTALSLSNQTNFYKTYIQKCKTSDINFDESFYYGVFGWDGSEAAPVPYGNMVKVTLTDPFNVKCL